MPPNTQRNLFCALLLLAALHLSFGAGPAAASGFYNLEEGLPVELADALPTAYRNLEIQGLTRWEHTGKGQERFLLEPRLEYGLWYNTQMALSFPYEFGEAVQEDEFKDIGLELFYNFNQETRFFPAVALAGVATFPTSEEGEGVDTTAKLVLTKTIGWSTMFHRLHLNAAWKHNNEALESERDDLYKFVVGYDRRMNAQTLLVIDYVREQKMEKDKEINLAEVGLRYQLTPLTVISAGVGAGFGEDSPDFRVVLAFQHSFNAWYLGERP